MKHIYALMAAALLGSSSLSAQDSEETVFSYAPTDATTQALGWGRYVDNDVAILLKDPKYVGYEIIGISVDVPAVDGCEVDPIGKAWLTSKLAVNPETCDNVPDIGDPNGVPGEIKNYGTAKNPVYRLEINFPEPYVLSAEGVYVGYTLKVTKLFNWTKKYPVQVAPMVNPPEGSLWMHSSYNQGSSTPPVAQHKAWQNMAVSNQAVSTMRVILRGRELSHGGLIVTPANIYAQQGSTENVGVEFFNYGTRNVSSADYTLTIGEESVSGSLSFNPPVGVQRSALAIIPVAIPAERGDYTLTLSTDKINGEENLYGNKSASSALYVRPWIPRKRVLVEEYSGTWCGYCPEAYVTVKQLQDVSPSDIIAVSYHVDDRLTTIYKANLPCPAAGTPDLIFDRVEMLENLPEAASKFDSCMDALAPADLDVDIFWTDDTKKELRVESTMKFLDDADNSRYLVSYVLVEDKMSSSLLKQRNFFSNAASYSSEYYQQPYWDLFVGQPYEVEGLVYDEIAMICKDPSGIPGSLPEVITGGETYTHDAVLALADAKCVYSSGSNFGKNVIMNPANLRVVAVLTDTSTGRAVNANTSGYAGEAKVYDPTTGVTMPGEDAAEVVATEYYTLSGVRLAGCPTEGAYIVVKHLSNGKTVAAKYLH